MPPSSVLSAAGLAIVVVACSGNPLSASEAIAGMRARSRVEATSQKPKPTTQPPTAVSPAVDPTAAIKAFEDRLREYVKFHNNVAKMVPPLNETADPARITARERMLGEQIIKSRPDARPGDFFVKQVQPILTQIIKDDFSRRSATDRKALVQELPKGVAIKVNMRYPEVLPLGTFPANLLKKLPELPKELEYRIVGRSLILRDVAANVVVDVMRDVIPIPA